ncbi:MAG: type IV secretory system conjugative DNA transfer family protein [Anaerolineae bacterium]|nr:type IV secretory system conjugative DNA transfer family protein [Anaerolineae bacterium]
MDVNSMGQTTVGTYFKQWWQNLPPTPKKRWRTTLGIFTAIWLAGAIHAPTAVTGLARVEGPFRLLMALGMGGFSFLWRFLKSSGAIQETMDTPNLLWLPLAVAMPGAIGLFLYILSQPPNPYYGIQKMLERASSSQGRVETEVMREKLGMTQGVPLVQVGEDKAESRSPERSRRGSGGGSKKTLIGLDYERSEGHVMVVAPTRAGKGLHLTYTLCHYPGPALVVDPKGEQFARTAALRRRLVGPVYRIPGHQVHLSAYYRHLRDRDETIELHYHLLRPWTSAEPIFAEKALSLFTAVGLYADATRLNPIRLLLDLAESNPAEALAALRTVEAARRHVDIFTNGAAPDAYQEDKFVTSALGNFTTRLAPYQKHIDTIAPRDFHRHDLIVPPDWAARNATIYITYNLGDLRGVGGVVAAIIAAILRYHMRAPQESRTQSPLRGQKQKMLVAIDELPAVGLRNIVDYLSTCGGYGITLLLYVQSVAQLQGLYGKEGLRAILSNCDHQLWYPAAEMETARFMSELYGTTMKANPMQSASRSARRQQDKEGQAQMQTSNNQGASWSWREGATLSPNEIMALPQGQVLATTLAGRRYVFLGERLNSIHLFDQLPPPDSLHLPQPLYRPRRYTDWKAITAAPPPATATDRDGSKPETQENRAESDIRPALLMSKGDGGAAAAANAPNKPETAARLDDSNLSEAAKLMG